MHLAWATFFPIQNSNPSSSNFHGTSSALLVQINQNMFHLTIFSCQKPQNSSLVNFILFSPCPQKLLFSALNLIFIISLLFFAFSKLISLFIRKNSDLDLNSNKPLLSRPECRITTSLKYKFAFAFSILTSLAYFVLLILRSFGFYHSENIFSDIPFLALQFIANFSAAVLIGHEKKFGASAHPLTLRIYWTLSFVFTSLLVSSSIFKLTGGDRILPDDFISFALLPISGFYLYLSITGSTGVGSVYSEQETESARLSSNITPYASASLISRATWSWLNPLLTKGYKGPLNISDIPNLAPEHDAERMAEIFRSNWPKPVGSVLPSNPLRTTLMKCFWPKFVFSGILCVVKLMVMFVGPTLVTRFVDYVGGNREDISEGFKLCGMLLVSKFFEVLSSHQFNFVAGYLSMLVRSTLITAIYRKGLKLSCISRQKYGLGSIVNYMQVDAQMVADLSLQIHYLWLTPMQAAVAIGLLFLYLGVSVLAAVVGVAFTLWIIVVLTKKSNGYQFLLMGMKDKRMKAMNEMLNNMRVIKFQAWEDYFSQRINKFRMGEFTWLSKFLYTFSANMTALFSSGTCITVLTFGASTFLGMPLTAGTVFTATSFFRLLSTPMRTFPQALISTSQAFISIGRLEEYLASDELNENDVERVVGCGDGIAIEVKDGTFAWGEEEEDIVLKGLNIEVKRGTLAAVVGTVGSGKSSLISCLLGEMRKISGKVRVCGTTAYVAQTAWIQNGTIQDNILFGEPMVREKYKEVIRVCCLEKDLEMMEFGDQTEIGERGINLSGGQKQRIQLARAVYQDCDIYFLDDVFSAVDAHTGSELFKECVRGALKSKTVMLITHQVDFLHNADLILVMKDGEIIQSGKYDELLASGSTFETLVSAHDTSMELVMHNSSDGQSSTSEQPAMKRELSNKEKNLVISPKAESRTAKLINEEERETGRVGWSVYKLYLTEAWGWKGVILVAIVAILAQVSSMASDYWLAYETSDKTSDTFRADIFIIVLSLIGLVSLIFVAANTYLVTYLGLVTAQVFFKGILESILHAPMSFFDTTPSGRILARVSSDQSNIDLFLPLFMGLAVTCYFSVIAIIVVICQVSWPTIIFVIPLGWLNMVYRRYYLATSRELTRFDGITKAPVIHHFSETVLGVTTIRCFRKERRFCQENVDKVNSSLRMDFHNNATGEWLGFRLELIGCFILCISALLMVMLPKNFVKSEYVGLSLSYGFALNSVLFFAVWLSCSLENRMVSVERLKQFTNIPSEAAWKLPECLPPPNWPTHGNIDIFDLKVRYRENTPLILKGITLNIKGGEKIGVVGRTGSGKSTFIQALFRVVEPCGGRIIIDNVDICKIGLHDLRSRFGIIPQEPVLLEGTVRSNIDPAGKYTDEEIWQSLERCQLKDVVAAKAERLDALVVDSGENWSVGQRQLLCLGRVMLKRSKILFMDEATASVDSQTDGVIQKIIREDFAACTIISIAHRIPTVMDCDRVLVIDAGRAREFDSPSKLMEQPSIFSSLVQEYANRSTDM